MINNNISQKDSDTKDGQKSVLNRRLFLRSAGVATAVGTLAMGACKDDDDDMEMDEPDANAAPGEKKTQQQPSNVQQQDVMVH